MNSGLLDPIQSPRVIAVLLTAVSIAGASRAQAQCAGRWVPDFGGGMTGGGINALTLMHGGDLAAGGTFTAAGGAPAHYVARWNGSSWSSVGPTGVFNPILSLAVLGNGDLVAGGGLESLNPITGHGDYITRWNGTSWSNLGLGVQNTVYSLALGPDGQFVAGGYFTVAGGNDAFGIASWDGSNWSPLGTGMEGPGPFPADSGFVFTTAVAPNGDVYAGGTIMMAGGMNVNRVARWDGVSWSPLGAGVSGNPSGGAVFAFAFVPGGDVIVGGSFTIAGATPANNIARWDGSSWSALGDGVSNASGSPSVNALAVMPNGDLIAAGSFTSAGGVSANAMARWDGAAWSPLGAGLTGGSFSTIVKALVVMPNGDLVASGAFAFAGGVPTGSIARWTTACNQFCGADFNNDGDVGTDADIDAFFACLAGNCCTTCGSADFNGDGDIGTDADIDAFFRVLGGGPC